MLRRTTLHLRSRNNRQSGDLHRCDGWNAPGQSCNCRRNRAFPQVWLSALAYDFYYTSTGTLLGSRKVLPQLPRRQVLPQSVSQGRTRLSAPSRREFRFYQTGQQSQFQAVWKQRKYVRSASAAGPLSRSITLTAQLWRLGISRVVSLFSFTTRVLSSNTSTTTRLHFLGRVSETGWLRFSQVNASGCCECSDGHTQCDGLEFRSTTLTMELQRWSQWGSSVSLTVPTLATLGTVSTYASRLALIALNNAGTVELGIVNLSGGLNLDETFADFDNCN